VTVLEDEIPDWYLYDRLDADGDSASAESQVLDRIPDEDVKRALDELPEGFRMAVWLADVEGFAYKEIAEILGIPIGTVMSRLHRGRKALEKRLREKVRERGLVSG
jgi:RNA polymerase sigma-70 factor (ECF subfamily)